MEVPKNKKYVMMVGDGEATRAMEKRTTWQQRRLLAGCPRGLSALSTSAAGLFSGKKKVHFEKFRLISGHFEKFRLLYEKRKVETHIWTL